MASVVSGRLVSRLSSDMAPGTPSHCYKGPRDLDRKGLDLALRRRVSATDLAPAPRTVDGELGWPSAARNRARARDEPRGSIGQAARSSLAARRSFPRSTTPFWRLHGARVRWSPLAGAVGMGKTRVATPDASTPQLGPASFGVGSAALTPPYPIQRGPPLRPWGIHLA